MKAVLKVFLAFCYVAAFGAAAASVRLLLVHRPGVIFVGLTIVLPLMALATQYVFFGSWNPLKLFKKVELAVPNTEVTRAPWGP